MIIVQCTQTIEYITTILRSNLEENLWYLLDIKVRERKILNPQ